MTDQQWRLCITVDSPGSHRVSEVTGTQEQVLKRAIRALRQANVSGHRCDVRFARVGDSERTREGNEG